MIRKIVDAFREELAKDQQKAPSSPSPCDRSAAQKAPVQQEKKPTKATSPNSSPKPVRSKRQKRYTFAPT